MCFRLFGMSLKNEIRARNVTKTELRIRKNCTFNEKWLLFQLCTSVLLCIKTLKL
jgi:hypothetical protein